MVCLQEHKLQGSHTSGMAEAMGLLVRGARELLGLTVFLRAGSRGGG